jgi:hypothetical protein
MKMTKEFLNKYLAQMINETDCILQTRKVDNLTRQQIKMHLYVKSSNLLKKLSKGK